MKYAIVDIETTGSNAQKDRITEIAVIVHDGVKIIEEFSSLINPECPIPAFISRLTGITDEMVETAPRFFEVAKKIVQLTDGAIFVAHNAPFDYGFLRQSFKSLGFNYSRDYLCTVRLSRKILPGFRSYSLGNLCRSLDINIENRHRAGGDAIATTKLFERILEKNNDENVLSEFIRNDYLNLRFPPNFNRKLVDNLPETCGVYYLHDENGNIIYIGKSNNIRKRILSHFRNKQSRKSIELRNSILDISFDETGNELIALLKESEEIKKNQPIFNRRQKKSTQNQSIFLSTNENGYLILNIAKENINGDPIITTSTHDQAVKLIDKLITKFNLCQKLCSYKNIAHACFAYSVRQCNGACIGKEDINEYNRRVQLAIESIEFKNKNFLIIGDGRSSSEKSVVQIEKGRYLGYGYFETEFTGTDADSLKDFVRFKEDNRDVHRILNYHLYRSDERDVITY